MAPYISKQYWQIVNQMAQGQRGFFPDFQSITAANSDPTFVRLYMDEQPINRYPLVITQSLVSQFERLTGSLARIMYKVFTAFIEAEGSQVADFLDESELAIELVQKHPFNPRNILQRHDMVITDGQLRLIEINAGSQIGGYQMDFFAAIMDVFIAQDTLIDEWNTYYLPGLRGMLTAVMNAIRRIKPLAKGHVALLIDDQRGEYECFSGFLNQLYRDVAQGIFSKHSLTMITDVSALSYADNTIYVAGKEVDALMVSLDFELPENHLIQFTRASSAGTCFVPDSPLYTWISNKNLLALVHEAKERGFVNAEEAQFIDDFFPWGQVLGRFAGNPEKREQLRQRLLSQQQQLIMKKARSMQGIDVHIGKYLSQDQWQALVEQHLDNSHWLVQEYCEPDPLPGIAPNGEVQDCAAIWGIFEFETQYHGGFVRTAWPGDCSDGVINSAKGAWEFMLYQDSKKSKKLKI